MRTPSLHHLLWLSNFDCTYISLWWKCSTFQLSVTWSQMLFISLLVESRWLLWNCHIDFIIFCHKTVVTPNPNKIIYSPFDCACVPYPSKQGTMHLVNRLMRPWFEFHQDQFIREVISWCCWSGGDDICLQMNKKKTSKWPTPIRKFSTAENWIGQIS